MSILLGGQTIFVGDVLNTVADHIPPQHRLETPNLGGWPHLRFIAPSIFGLPALLAEVLAPFEDREITQQIFELSLDGGEQDYLARLESHLGPPVKTARYPVSTPWQVAFTAEWLVDNLRVSLSIYGGRRPSHAGMATAGLFIDLKDELPIAEKYLTALSTRESALFDGPESPAILEKVTVQQVLRPFYIPDYTAPNPHVALSDSTRRRAQKAFYKRHLLETPPLLSTTLTKRNVVLWRRAANTFVSTRWDTVLIVPGKTAMSVTNLLPAKGAGGMDVHIDELALSDLPGSTVLQSLVDRLKDSVVYSYQEDYDV